MRRFTTALSVSLLLALGLAFVYLIVRLFYLLTSLDQPLIIAVLAGCATILASTITVVVGKIIERRSEIEAHFRQRKFEQYYELLKLLYELTQQTGDPKIDPQVVKRLVDWQRNLILFAGPKTIRCFVAWFSNLKSGNLTIRSISLMEEFYKSLRSDLGISNLGLRDGDLAHLVLRHGDLFVAILQKNPNMPLAELIKLEKEREATQVPTSANAKI